MSRITVRRFLASALLLAAAGLAAHCGQERSDVAVPPPTLPTTPPPGSIDTHLGLHLVESSPGAANDLSADTAIVQWGLASAGTPDNGNRVTGASDGAYTLDLGSFMVGVALAVNVQVTDGSGKLIASQSLTPLTVPASGVLAATVTLP